MTSFNITTESNVLLPIHVDLVKADRLNNVVKIKRMGALIYSVISGVQAYPGYLQHHPGETITITPPVNTCIRGQ